MCHTTLLVVHLTSYLSTIVIYPSRHTQDGTYDRTDRWLTASIYKNMGSLGCIWSLLRGNTSRSVGSCSLYIMLLKVSSYVVNILISMVLVLFNYSYFSLSLLLTFIWLHGSLCPHVWNPGLIYPCSPLMCLCYVLCSCTCGFICLKHNFSL